MMRKFTLVSEILGQIRDSGQPRVAWLTAVAQLAEVADIEDLAM